MHFACRSFIGSSRSDSWSQFWENEPDDPVLVAQRGHLFGLVSFKTADSGEAAVVGRQLISQINEAYFSPSDLKSSSWLKQTLDQLSLNIREQFENVSVVLVVISHSQAILATLGTGKIFLKRQSQISPLLSGDGTQVTLISGPVYNDDRLLLSTDNFYQQIGSVAISSCLAPAKIQDVEENFLSRIYSLADQSGVAAALIQANTDPLDTAPPSAPVSANLPLVDSPSPPSVSIFKRLLAYRRPVYISHHENTNLTRRKKFNILLALIILITFSVSIYFGSRQNKIKQTESEYQTLKSQFQAKFDNAQTVRDLNLNQAQTIARESKAILNNMIALKIHQTEVDNLVSQVDSLLVKTGSADDYNPEYFYDTSNIDDQADYSKMVISKNFLYLLDPVNSRLGRLDVSNKSQQKISSSPILTGAADLAGLDGDIYILKDKQIYQVVGDNLVSKIDLPASVKDFQTGHIGFWNGSLYLLADSAIWKFSPNSSGFSQGVSWLKSGETLSSSPSAMAINGSVWILDKSGAVVPYSRGSRESYTSQNSLNLTTAANLVTSVDSDILAFTEGDNLVYIFGKKTASAHSYNFGSKKILSLALDTVNNFLLVLCTDHQIYKISL